MVVQHRKNHQYYDHDHDPEATRVGDCLVNVVVRVVLLVILVHMIDEGIVVDHASDVVIRMVDDNGVVTETIVHDLGIRDEEMTVNVIIEMNEIIATDLGRQGN